MVNTQRATNYDVSQIFLGGNWYVDGTYTNTTGAPVTINPGTLIGAVGTTAGVMNVLPSVSTAVDGTEFPIGIAADNMPVTVANGASAVLSICVKGRVNQNALTLGAGDTLNTMIRSVSTGGRTILNQLIAVGIQPTPTVELSVQDPNQ